MRRFNAVVASPRKNSQRRSTSRPRPAGGDGSRWKSGFIDGYRAILNRERLGLAVCAFVHVSIDRQYSEVVSELYEKIKRRPEVLECYATTGDADFTLRVVARDIADYDRFLQDFLFELPGVGRVRTSIALREIKQTTELPLEP